jgi:hypothetical protein
VAASARRESIFLRAERRVSPLLLSRLRYVSAPRSARSTKLAYRRGVLRSCRPGEVHALARHQAGEESAACATETPCVYEGHGRSGMRPRRPRPRAQRPEGGIELDEVEFFEATSF